MTQTPGVPFAPEEYQVPNDPIDAAARRRDARRFPGGRTMTLAQLRELAAFVANADFYLREFRGALSASRVLGMLDVVAAARAMEMSVDENSGKIIVSWEALNRVRDALAALEEKMENLP